MGRLCNQELKIIILIVLILFIKYLTSINPHAITPTLTSMLESVVLQAVILTLSVAIGVYTRSIVTGLLTLAFLSPHAATPILRYQWYFMIGFTLLALSLLSYLRGPHDSVLETLGFPVKAKLTPLLATLTLAYAYRVYELNITHNPAYWAHILFGGILLSKLARTPSQAIMGSLVASLGNPGALTISIYASLAPLPELNCTGTVIGRLTAYEAETSTTRTLTIRGKRWKTLGLACARGKAIVKATGKPIIWVYSIQPLDIVTRLSSILTTGKNKRIIIDLDAPGGEDVASILEGIKSGGNLVRVNLGSLEGPVKEGLLAALPEVLNGNEIVIISSCNYEPRDIMKYLEAISKKTILYSGFCRVSGVQLAPVKKPGETIVVIGDIGDPLEASTILGRLFGESWRRIHSLIRHDQRRILAYEYCNGGWALVELPI